MLSNWIRNARSRTLLFIQGSPWSTSYNYNDGLIIFSRLFSGHRENFNPVFSEGSYYWWPNRWSICSSYRLCWYTVTSCWIYSLWGEVCHWHISDPDYSGMICHTVMGCLYQLYFIVTNIVVTQIADGDICRSLTLPIYVLLPRLLVCPTLFAG